MWATMLRPLVLSFLICSAVSELDKSPKGPSILPRAGKDESFNIQLAEALWTQFVPKGEEFMSQDHYSELESFLVSYQSSNSTDVNIDAIDLAKTQESEVAWMVLCQTANADPEKGLNKEQFTKYIKELAWRGELDQQLRDLDRIWDQYVPAGEEFMTKTQFFALTSKSDPSEVMDDGHWESMCESLQADSKQGLTKKQLQILYYMILKREMSDLDQIWAEIVPRGQALMTKTQFFDLMSKTSTSEVNDDVWESLCQSFQAEPQYGITKKHLHKLYRSSPESSIKEDLKKIRDMKKVKDEL